MWLGISRLAFDGYLTHPDLWRLAGNGRSDSGVRGELVATGIARVTFEAGMLSEMNHMRQYMSPREPADRRATARSRAARLPGKGSPKKGTSSPARFSLGKKREELTARRLVSEHGRDLLLMAA